MVGMPNTRAYRPRELFRFSQIWIGQPSAPCPRCSRRHTDRLPLALTRSRGKPCSFEAAPPRSAWRPQSWPTIAASLSSPGPAAQSAARRSNGVDHVVVDDGQVAPKIREIVPAGVNVALELVGTPTLPIRCA